MEEEEALGRFCIQKAFQAEYGVSKWRCDYVFCIQEIKSNYLWMKVSGRILWTTIDEEREHITIDFSNRTFKFEMYSYLLSYLKKGMICTMKILKTCPSAF